MCSTNARKLSFRIDDLLKPSREIAEVALQGQDVALENIKISEKQCDVVKNCEETNEKPIRSSISSSENSVFQPYPRLKNTKTSPVKDFSQYDNYNKASESLYSKKLLGQNDRDYMYNSALGRSMLGCPSNYGFHMGSRLHLPSASPYLDYSTGFSNVVESPPHWIMSPGLVGYGLGGCTTLGYPPYLRPLPMSSLAKRKGGQVRFTPQQTQSLERRFGSHKYLSPEDRRLLAGQLKLSDRQVKTWFQNRRAKWRRANNLTTTESEELESDNQSDEEMSSNKSSTVYQKNSPIFVG